MIELVKLGERFGDDPKHYIQNLAEHPVGGVAVLFCKAGSSRSHHAHRRDQHDLFVLSGSMRYVEQECQIVDSTRGDGVHTQVIDVGAPMQRRINAGQMVHTGPNTRHSTYFDEDTILISLSKNARTHDAHEADLVRCQPLPWVE